VPIHAGEAVQIYSDAIGAGPTILLTHGFGATSAMWANQLEVLSERHRVVAWDLRGHGRTRTPADPHVYSQPAALADMAALLAPDNDPAILCGHSLGGYLSLAFTNAWPDRVGALILVATGPGYRDDAARAKWNTMAHRLARQIESNGGLPTAAGLHGASPSRPDGLVLAARGILPQTDATVIESLPTIRVPTLIIIGSEDRRFRAAAAYMADKIPGATIAIIENAGHLPNIEQPDAFNTHVLEFLAGLPTVPPDDPA
jgi:pimeloyl-ACP methyl ester carboxylesterase